MPTVERPRVVRADPEQHGPQELREDEGAGQAGRHSADGEADRLTEHEPGDPRRGGAKRDTDPDLVAPLAHAVEDAVQSERREQHSQLPLGSDLESPPG